MAAFALPKLDDMPEAAFVEHLGGVFEHSPWVAQRAFAKRPFVSVDALHAAMVAAMESASTEEQLGLLRAHPELAGKAAIARELTVASAREQHGAGLDRCTPAQLARLTDLNARYRERFGFPFILAVAGYDVEGILAAFERRLQNDIDAEMTEARRQVARIARFRLDSLVA